MNFIKLSDDSKEYIYTLTEDAAPAGFEIAESVQFKVQQADKNVCLFVRENADAEWVRADKRLIQMIDEATPREETPAPTPTPTPQPTPAATPAPTPAPYAAARCRPSADRRWFPTAGYCGRVSCVCDRYRAADR